MLLDGINDQTTSGQQSASGSDTISWEISWNEIGFTGVSWAIGTWSEMASDFQTMYENNQLQSFFETPSETEYDLSRGFLHYAGGVLSLIRNDCVEFERLD